MPLNYLFLLVLLLSSLLLNAQERILTGRKQQTNTLLPAKLLDQKRSDHYLLLKNKVQTSSQTADADTCDTYVFKLKAGITNNEEQIYTSAALDNGDVLFAGTIQKSGTGDFDAYFLCLNQAGELLWAKTMGLPGRNESINKIQLTRNGEIIASGISKNNSTNNTDALLLLIDVNGTIVWNRLLNNTSFGLNITGFEVDETENGSFLFACTNSTDVFYGVITATGTFSWSKTMKTSQTVQKLAVDNADEYRYYIITAGIDTGYQVMNVCAVDPSNGNYVWHKKLGGVASGTHFYLQSVAKWQQEPYLYGTFSKDNAAFSLFRTRLTEWNPLQFEVYQTNVSLSTTLSSGTAEWSDFFFYKSNNTTSDIYLLIHPQESRIKKQVRFSAGFPLTSLQITSGVKTADGGFLTSGILKEASGGAKLFVLKTDSIGMMPLCSPVTEYISKTDSFLNNIVVPVTATNTLMQTTTQTLNSAGYTPAISVSCKQTYCPQPAPEDTCLSTFFKHYRSSSFNDVAISISMVEDSSLVVSGVSDGSSMMLKLNKNGKLLVRKKVQFNNSGSIALDHKTLNDGNVAALFANTGPNGSVNLNVVKYDKNLNELWSKSYAITPGYRYADMNEDASGNIYLFFYYAFGFATDFTFIKLNNTGSLIWVKSYVPSNQNVFVFWNGKFVIKGNSIYASINYNYDNFWRTLLININTGDGSVVWAKDYSQAGKNLRISLIGFINNDMYYLGETDVTNAQAFPFLLKTRTDGSVQRAKRIQIKPEETLWGTNDQIISRDGDMIINWQYQDYINYPNLRFKSFMRVDTALNLTVSRRTKRVTGYDFVYDAVESADRSIYEVGINYYDESYYADFYLQKKLSDGAAGTCFTENNPFSLIEEAVTVSTVTLTNVSNFTVTPASVPYTVSRLRMNQNQLFCVSSPLCSTLKIIGPGSVCDTSQVYTFFYNRNAGCDLAVNGSFNSSQVQVVSGTDSSISVKFKQNGSFQLNAQLFSGCNTYRDSILITVVSSPGSFSLGTDRVLCKDSSVLLRAPAGFKTYKWQNNSTDSLFLVAQAGLYYVTVTDSCNRIYSDTVIVTADAPPAFSIQPADPSICKNDTLRLSVPAGLTNYSWWPQSQLQPVSATAVQVFPSQTASYGIQAFTANGCVVRDTVSIVVNVPSSIRLGNDTSFCVGNSLLLDAGPGFVSYIWNTGSSGRQIRVSQKGTYTVQATDINNCISKDTLLVRDIYPLPTVSVGNDTSICKGSFIVLRPGNYSRYLWQDGSTAATYQVRIPGLYWITVTDAFGCKNTDTMRLLALYPSPENFLADTLSFCPGRKVDLRPNQSYSAYLWSSGSKQPSISILQPGNYWLQVTNANKCIGSDTISVKYRDCVSEVYFPNAFTPNNDQLNDEFKPIVWGLLNSYKLRIFNRFGQLVFESTDPMKGWDGTQNGKPLDHGTFSWTCSYQFALTNAPLLNKKGLVYLIR